MAPSCFNSISIFSFSVVTLRSLLITNCCFHFLALKRTTRMTTPTTMTTSMITTATTMMTNVVVAPSVGRLVAGLCAAADYGSSSCGNCSFTYGGLYAATDWNSSSCGNCLISLGCRGYSDSLGRGWVQFCAKETHIMAFHVNSNKRHEGDKHIFQIHATMKHQLGAIM